MKKFNKIFIVIIMVVIFSTAINVISFAETAIETTEGIVNEGEGQTDSTDDLTEPQSAFEAFIEVVKTVVGQEFMAVVSTGINIGLLVFMAILKKNSKVGLTDIAKCVMAKDANGNNVSLAAVVKKLNDTANANAEELAEFKKEVNAHIQKLCETYSVQTVTHEQVQEIAIAAKAMLNMFHAVYSQSRTIGAATKTQEEEYYAEAMRGILKLEAEDVNNERET